MPLAFPSLSHGQVAFGFFNIKSDMLLLERHFFFATEFCQILEDMAEGGATYLKSWSAYFIERPEDIGDLMGAIHGVRYSGFMGALYRQFPFPRNPAAFRQDPQGYRTQGQVNALIRRYASPVDLQLLVAPDGTEMTIGVYRFNRPTFHDLIRYVWVGGYPRWQDDTPPDDVLAMKEAVTRSRAAIFEGLNLVG